jgi:hypothetical protein
MEPFDAQPTPPRRGRRDNGLGAERYVPLLDVDPRIGEHLLDVLRLAGVPAYLEPAMDIDSYTRATSIPSPPTDRLWVDTQRRDTARDIVTAETSAPIRPGRAGDPPTDPPTDPAIEPGKREEIPSHGLSDLDEELAWREIVSRYDRDYMTDSSRGGLPPWPASEDMDQPPVVEEPPDATAEPPQPERRPGGAHRADRRSERGDRRADRSTDRRRAEPTDDDPEDHFVPPPLPPVPRLSKQTILALFLIAAGALLLLWPDGLGFSEQSSLALGVIMLISAGGLLVLRLRDDRYDGPDDDGAVL